jgi:membrane fusion protein (multidrug efflux system)
VRRIVMKRNRTTAVRSFFRQVSVIIIPMLLFTAAGCKKPQIEAPQPPVVDVADVIQRDVPIFMEWVASTDGSVNATIRAQVSGYLIKRYYKEGDLVKTGQLLFQIDPRLFQAALDQSKGELALQQARWNTAKANLKRIKPLAEQNAVSQKDLDDATGQEQATHAAVISAQASVDKARLDLGFTKVTSLIDGVAGIAKAQIGDLVGPGQIEELTTVSTVNPIKVYVPISEQEYLKAMEERSKRSERAVLEMILSDGSIYPYKGEFTFADRQVDPTTGTIKVASLFPNPGNLLRPGQFARIRAQIGIVSGALLVPQRAVIDIQGTYQVAVVGPGNKIDIRSVEVGERVKSLWVISKGLKAGEKIVVEGVQKVKQGMPVVPKPFVPEENAGVKQPAPIDEPAAAGKR